MAMQQQGLIDGVKPAASRSRFLLVLAGVFAVPELDYIVLAD